MKELTPTEKAVLAGLVTLLFVLTAARYFQEQHRRTDIRVVRPETKSGSGAAHPL